MRKPARNKKTECLTSKESVDKKERLGTFPTWYQGGCCFIEECIGITRGKTRNPFLILEATNKGAGRGIVLSSKNLFILQAVKGRVLS